MYHRRSLPLIAALFAVAVLPPLSLTAAERPNVVVIMTDNHGQWTLGCYGNQDIRTPNIDRLAREGTLFTRAFASNPVCSPTRATFLTGLVPSQHGVHCFLVGGRLQMGPDARCTLDQVTSLPEVLRAAGYSCGLVGKWHLGDNLHPQEGFDDYWVTMPHGGTSTFYGAQVIEDGKVRDEPKYLTDFWTEHAVNFIEQSAGDDKPFFLFLSYNGPYALSRLLLNEGQNRHAEYYADKALPSFPREPAHPWQYNNLDYHNNPVSIRRVATEVSGIDDGVGTVMQTLKKHGLDENTLVVFTADQGWAGGHGGFFGMGDHTRPVTAHDAMMQIPMIWRHPSETQAGATSDRMVANYDFMPTLLSYLGLDDHLPEQPKSPGRDFSDSLRRHSGETSQAATPNSQPPPAKTDALDVEDEDAIFYEFESLRCIRTERWKYVHRHPNGPHELYDLANDPEEFNNLVSTAAGKRVLTPLRSRLEAFFDQYAVPQYDMWRGGGSQTRVFVGIDEELAQLDPVEPPPLTDGFTPQKFNLPDGFTAELAAGPPLVSHPTFATFDDRGRLFVSENAGVNMTAAELEEHLPNSIVLLEDTDQDGRFDKRTVFADKMTFPMGGAWHEGALYVASPPSIWRLEDTTGDGVADRREVLVDKFGFTGNAASIHGCISGPDGRLYWCDGFHGHEFRDETGQITSKRAGSYIFSCLPDGSDVRIHCGGGMDNPVEVDFTDEGEMLGTVNILHSRPRVDALVHWLYGGAYPHREKILDEVKVTGDLLGPVHDFGHVAVSGAQRYRSGAMDHRWRDNFFVTFFNTGKVVRVELERDGASFAATQREFLSCESRDFHPTDVAEDADGSLLVVDTGGWFYRGCPTSQFAKPDVLGAIYRVRRTGMTTQVDPRGSRIDWAKASDAELAALLGDTRFAVRERAIVECARRGEAILPTLSTTLQRGDLPRRMGSVWALTRMLGTADSTATQQATLRQALADAHPSVRQAACQSLATYPDPAAVDQLLELVRHDQPPVRRAAATALGRSADAKAVPTLLGASSRSLDRTEEHAIVYALIEINDPTATRAGLTANHGNTQRCALIALDQMDAGDLTASDVVPLVAAEDGQLQRAAANIFSRHADWASHSADVIARLLERPDSITLNADVIRKLTTQALADDAVATLVGRSLADPSTPRATGDLLLSAIAGGQALPLHDSWVRPLRERLSSDEPSTIARAIDAIGAIQTDRFDDSLKQLGADDMQAVLLRVAALETVSGRRGHLTNESLDLLIELLEGGPSESLQAAQKIGASSLDKSQLIRLAAQLPRAAPSPLQELLRPFERSGDPEVAAAFLAGMKNARGLTTLAPQQFSDVIKRYPPELLPQANALLEQLRQQEQQKLIKLDTLMPLLAQGDAARGRELFFGEKSKCSSCHRVAEEGGTIGPDLTTIGANRAAADLLESLVFPSATIVRDYETVVVRTADGRVLSGLIARETVDTLFIQQQTGEPVAVPRDEIEELAPSPVSIMPSGLEEALSESELADVIAYLRSLKTASAPSID